jgi:hypothetical protein
MTPCVIATGIWIERTQACKGSAAHDNPINELTYLVLFKAFCQWLHFVDISIK